MGFGTEAYGGVGGEEAPSLLSVSPASGGTITDVTPVVFDLLSTGSALEVVVVIEYPNVAVADAAYDGTGLTPLFRNPQSSVALVGASLRFTLLRTARWPDTSFVVRIFAADSNGSLSTALAWNVTRTQVDSPAAPPAQAPTRVDQFGVGLALPFRWGSSNDFVRLVGPDLVNTMVAQVLGTKRGELRWRPSFGASLDTLRHRGNTRALDELARVQVERALGRWVPQVRVLGTVADPITDATRNQLVISTAYQLGNGQAQAAQALV